MYRRGGPGGPYGGPPQGPYGPRPYGAPRMTPKTPKEIKEEIM